MGTIREASAQKVRGRAVLRVRTIAVVAFAAVALIAGASALSAQEPMTPDQVIAQGRVVYEANCAACHQADGAGVPGAFPPLVGNDRVDDSDYLTDVIRNGLVGPIQVSGVDYDGAMPAFASLTDEEVGALVAYVQEALGAPLPPPPDTGDDAGDVAGTELPFGVVVVYGVGFLVAAIAAVLVIGPIILGRREEAAFTTPQVWLKSAGIVLYFVVATVIVPSMVMQSGLLAEPPSVYSDLFSSNTWGTIRDLIGSGVWVGALLLGLWMLRRAQRNRVI